MDDINLIHSNYISDGRDFYRSLERAGFNQEELRKLVNDQQLLDSVIKVANQEHEKRKFDLVIVSPKRATGEILQKIDGEEFTYFILEFGKNGLKKEVFESIITRIVIAEEMYSVFTNMTMHGATQI